MEGLNKFPEKKKRQEEDEGEKNMTRRGFLRGLAATAGTAAAGYVAKKSWDEYKQQEVGVEDSVSETAPETSLRPESRPEQKEEIPLHSESFFQEQAMYERVYTLAYDEVQFVGEDNILVGEPVPFKNYVVQRERTNGSGQTETFDYLLAPGPVNEVGMVTDGIAREWLRYVEQQVAEAHPDEGIVRQYNVATDFRAAFSLESEPDLIGKIKSGEVRRYVDIVLYFANRPLSSAENMTRLEYVENEITFHNLPDSVADELRRLVPGLCAQESKFNERVVSPSDARGTFQFLPSTWVDDYNQDMSDITDIKVQTEVAGRFLSDIYRQLQVHTGPGTLDKIQEKFPDEESFQRDFIVPLILNSYNAGSRRIGEGVAAYVAEYGVEDLPVGKDAFVTIANFMNQSDNGVLSRYGVHAREYVTRVYAQAGVLAQERQT